jgi:hypothetical protein
VRVFGTQVKWAGNLEYKYYRPSSYVVLYLKKAIKVERVFASLVARAVVEISSVK